MTSDHAEAERGMAWLKQAVATGYKNASQIKSPSARRPRRKVSSECSETQRYLIRVQDPVAHLRASDHETQVQRAGLEMAPKQALHRTRGR